MRILSVSLQAPTKTQEGPNTDYIISKASRIMLYVHISYFFTKKTSFSFKLREDIHEQENKLLCRILEEHGYKVQTWNKTFINVSI